MHELFLFTELKLKLYKMKRQDVVDAYIRIRTIDNTIPDEVLDFMKNCAIEKLEVVKKNDLSHIVRNCFPTLKERGEQESFERHKRYGEEWMLRGQFFNEGFLVGYNWTKRMFKAKLGNYS